VLAPFAAAGSEDSRGFDDVEKSTDHFAGRDGFTDDRSKVLTLASTDPQLLKACNGRSVGGKLLFVGLGVVALDLAATKGELLKSEQSKAATLQAHSEVWDSAQAWAAWPACGGINRLFFHGHLTL
jgi:hypothetical protein